MPYISHDRVAQFVDQLRQIAGHIDLAFNRMPELRTITEDEREKAQTDALILLNGLDVSLNRLAHADPPRSPGQPHLRRRDPQQSHPDWSRHR